jgi:hypothetical protein
LSGTNPSPPTIKIKKSELDAFPVSLFDRIGAVHTKLTRCSPSFFFFFSFFAHLVFWEFVFVFVFVVVYVCLLACMTMM